MSDEHKFLNHISEHYDKLRGKFYKFCENNNYTWNSDIFDDTIIKCYDAIRRKGGLKDTSKQGLENYFFQSFKTNLQRETQYARVLKRDFNINSDNVNTLYEEWFNENEISGKQKLKNDLFIDFATLYILSKVEEHFDSESFYLFKIKYLSSLTYKQVYEKTKIKGSRQKIITVKKWLQDNVTKEEIKEAFNRIYGEIINE